MGYHTPNPATLTLAMLSQIHLNLNILSDENNANVKCRKSMTSAYGMPMLGTGVRVSV
jgi:hypothetical protein